VENRERMLDEAELRAMSTGELVRHAIAEAQLLARAEILHAKQELKSEIKAAKKAGIFLGAALALALSGLAILLATIAVALPMAEWVSFLIVGFVILGIAGGLGFLGVKSLPKKPLPKTQERLKKDFVLTREQLA